MSLNTTEELIADIRVGKMVILMDDEDRENEGDFILAAECVRPQDINFMARYGRGLICLPLTPEHCRRLNLPLMVHNAYSNHSTNFTVSIEAATGVTTGISAADRAVTIQAAVAADAKPADLVQPGHVFPLMAHAGGVLSRAGHTEAGCDLARLAGLAATAVIVEILNEDGTMARRADLEQMALVHNLKIGTIADLIRYRIENEKTIERVAENTLSTEFGNFKLVAFKDGVKGDMHFALVKGEIAAAEPILVRVHLENPIYDLTGSLSGKASWALKDALVRVAREEKGVIVVLCKQFEPAALIEQVASINNADSTQKGAAHKPRIDDFRTIGLGSQILSDLGVHKMRVMSTPKRYHALSGFGLEIVEYITE